MITVRTAFCRAWCFLAVALGASTASAQENTLPGRITFNGLLQTWYLAGGGVDDTFKIRRAELKLAGDVSRRVRWTLMVDPAKMLMHPNPGIVVQDVFITLKYHRRVNLNVGQFKVPLSLEGLESSADLDTERALFSSDRSRGGVYGDVRDVGVMAYGPLARGLDYQFGFFDGSGNPANDQSGYDSNAIAARLVYRPVSLPGLQIGTSHLRGKAPAGKRERSGQELRYVNGPLTLQAEYMTGQDGYIARKGYYTHFAHRLGQKWEAILRYDTWDPDTSLESTAASVTERDYIAGFNYLIDGERVKLQFNCVRKTFQDDIADPFYEGAMRLQIFW